MCSNCKRPTREPLGSKNIDDNNPEPNCLGACDHFFEQCSALAWRQRQVKDRQWHRWAKRRNHKATLCTNFYRVAQIRLACSTSLFCCSCCSEMRRQKQNRLFVARWFWSRDLVNGSTSGVRLSCEQTGILRGQTPPEFKGTRSSCFQLWSQGICVTLLLITAGKHTKVAPGAAAWQRQ